MNTDEFLHKYSTLKVKFECYYKDTFIFNAITKGAEIAIWIAGEDARFYNLDIDADEEYLIGNLSEMVWSAEVETKETTTEIRFAPKNQQTRTGKPSKAIEEDRDYVQDRLVRYHHIDPAKFEGVSTNALKEYLIHNDGQLIAKLWSDIRQRSAMVLELVREREEEKAAEAAKEALLKCADSPDRSRILSHYRKIDIGGRQTCFQRAGIHFLAR